VFSSFAGAPPAAFGGRLDASSGSVECATDAGKLPEHWHLTAYRQIFAQHIGAHEGRVLPD
jgi:hypothetical protein